MMKWMNNELAIALTGWEPPLPFQNYAPPKDRFRLSHPHEDMTPLCSMKGRWCFGINAVVPYSSPFLEPIKFFCYWRSNLAPFERKQVATIKSFFATQNERFTDLTLYSDSDISSTTLLKELLERFSPRFSFKVYDAVEMARGTVLEHWDLLKASDSYAYPDSDLFRLLVLYRYGGVYFDMDTLLMRDFSPLLDEEFVMEWSCGHRRLDFFDNSIIRFKKQSKALETILLDIQNFPAGHTNWGGTNNLWSLIDLF
jgi:hypothetical protein